MFETGIRQFRMAMSMVWGRPIDPKNMERLVEDGLKTLKEFGAPGDDVQQLLEGPLSDPEARREFQNRAIERTVDRMARFSPYYQKLFAKHGIKANEITLEKMPQMPITRKQDFVEHQQAFICTNAHPFIATRTTGTTGRPAEIWLSKYESELWAGLSTLSGLLRNEIHPEDLMQINISSRATAAVQTSVTVCRLAGARVRVLGTIPPEESLDNLIGNGEEAPSLLSTYPSYLAMLVKAAQQRGLTPHDFRLRRIDCGGEILSNSLAQAAREVFGARINDTFGMTEVLPVDFFRNKEGSYQAQQSRRRFWLVLVADSHANPQVMQSHGDHGQGITHSGPRIAQNISDTAVSLEPSIAVFNADPS